MLGLIFFLAFMTAAELVECRVKEKLPDSHCQIPARFSANTSSGYLVAALIEVGSRHVHNLTLHFTNLTGAPNVPKSEQCCPNDAVQSSGHLAMLLR